ncbi:murein biosynthesis integral membrane protein MurJ [Desulfospira joergensenii]|uniref:murein biosynthesis integral membrane protein MurJ n=1 Tax=Desulfospira joergensenii TaxID=53329 RepID=UPI0003B526C6|nr:murein biosynthesis integral membrane protein MurJ [Desulfospira joergensenii]
MSDSSTIKKISIASFIMMTSVFASRVIGLAREAVIAWAGGAKAPVDAYQVAFVIPEILNHIAASGFLSITFIPIFARYISQGRDKEGYQVFSTILNGFGFLLLGFILVTMVWAPEFVRLLAPGMKDPVTFELAVKMTRIIIPAQFFFFCGGLFMAIQFAREKFLIPALAPLIYNLGIIAGGVLLSPRFGMEGFAWGVLGGAFLGSFLFQFIGAAKTGMKYYLIFHPRHPDFRRYILLTLPLMLGLTMTFSTEILLKFFGSFLDEGRIAAMNYAIRILFILVGFFGQAVGMASYPFMAKIAALGDMDRLNRIINQTLKFIFLAIPFSVLFMVLRHEIVQVLFQRGRFDAEAARLTAGILPFFLAGTFAFSAQTIVARGYFALQNTLFPAIFSTLCVGASLPLIYLFMKTMGVQGVALGLTLSAAMNSFLLFECWNRKSQNKGKKEVYLFFLKMVFLGLMVAGVLFPVHLGLVQFIEPGSVFRALALCLFIGVIFLILMPLAGKSLRIQEISEFFDKIFSRLPFRS